MYMKRIFMLILILLVGCQEDKPLDIIPEKSDFELLINAKNIYYITIS